VVLKQELFFEGLKNCQKSKLPEPEQALDRYIFIDPFPPDPETSADKAPILSLLRGSFLQARKPSEWRGYLTPVFERDVKHIGRKFYIDGQWLYVGG
jgi:hypothetical protein